MTSYSQRSAIECLLKKERGTIYKVFGSLPSAAICFPNTYCLGASNLGLHFLYQTVNSRPDFLGERFFYDFRPLSLENRQPLNRFNILLFTIPYELDLANCLEMLHRAGIPLLRKDRTEAHPLICAGGIAVTMNPLPLYDFMDIMFLGDGELTLPALLDIFIKVKGKKQEILQALRGDTGFFVPGDGRDDEISKIPRRAMCHDLDGAPISSVFLTPDTEFPDTCLLEMTRGCPYNCAFCYIGHNQKPFRFHSFESIVQAMKDKGSMTSQFGLISSAVTAHPELDKICEYAMHERFNISFSSLRADHLSDSVIEVLLRSGQRTITLAPETGSDEFRSALAKSMTNDEILSAVTRGLRAGIVNLKLYFILGLPGEGAGEIEASAELVRKIQRILVEEGRKRGHIGEIIVAVSFFVPKPGTPFATRTQPTISELKKRQQGFRASLRVLPHVRFQPADPYEAAVQMLLSCGGRETARILLKKIKGQFSWKTALAQFKT